MEVAPNFPSFCSQSLDLDNEPLNEIEQNAQEKNIKRKTEHYLPM